MFQGNANFADLAVSIEDVAGGGHGVCCLKSLSRITLLRSLEEHTSVRKYEGVIRRYVG